MASLAPATTLAIADSQFNRNDLLRLGFRDCEVVPILFDRDRLDVEPDPAVAARLASDRDRGGVEWLFVGRISPNKAQHDLLKSFAAYRLAYDPKARLRLVGGSSSHLYERALETFAHETGCADAVTFAGSVTPEALAAYYRNADVLVCLSRHEGFGVPLLEAMHYGVPVVALRSTAVPETLGDAGLLVATAAPAVVSAAVDRVIGDSVLRQAMIGAGHARLEDFALDRCRAQFADVVRAACGEP
jgi:glycosyltransferase involved in cell wall biosynthesis